ncbi:MAG: hypothetical protein U0269_21795 [Polyangiales bacterium]
MRNAWKTAVLFSFAVASVHCSQPVTVPNCPAGQVLSANGREFQCVVASSNGDGGAAINIPNCSPGQVLTSSNGVFTCVTINTGGGDAGASIDVPQCAANEVLTAMGGTLRCVATVSPGPGLPNCASGEVLTAEDGGASCVRPINVPMCTAGQVLGVSGGALVCVTPPQPTPIPMCGPGQLLIASDGGFACESATSASIASQNMQLVTLQASIMTLQSAVTALQGTVTTLTTRVTALEGAPAVVGLGRYAGNTPASMNANIQDGARRGLTAAASLCTAAFGAGAHMCTRDEIYRSVSDGVIPGTANIARAWVYSTDATQANSTPISEPMASLHNNCAAYTYGTGDSRDTGTVFEFSPWAFNGQRVPKFWVGAADAACNRSYPIACCR